MMDKRLKMVKIIAWWMGLSTLPGIYAYAYYGLEPSLAWLAALEWAFYFLMIFCAMGLSRTQEWARRVAMRLFAVYFIGILVVIYYLSGPSFDVMIERWSVVTYLPPGILKKSILFVMVVYAIWPILAVLFLTYPRVKRIFDPNYDPNEEKEEEENN